MESTDRYNSDFLPPTAALPTAEQPVGRPLLPIHSGEANGPSGPRPAAPEVYARMPIWNATARLRSLSGERKKHERDSIRSRSQEGKPGTRKNKRWAHSKELVKCLRAAMRACGEEGDHLDLEALAASESASSQRPSAFYQLMQREGAEGALEAWAAAEAEAAATPQQSRSSRSASRRPRSRTEGDIPTISEEQAVRRAFGDTWQYIRRSEAVRRMLSELEACAEKAFARPHGLGSLVADSWQVAWDGDDEELSTASGEPPAAELEIFGLSAVERKVVHLLASALGLRSQSRLVEGLLREVCDGDGKALALCPPRRRCSENAAWAAPLSVARVLAAV
jgi:hypothetical protein